MLNLPFCLSKILIQREMVLACRPGWHPNLEPSLLQQQKAATISFTLFLRFGEGFKDFFKKSLGKRFKRSVKKKLFQVTFSVQPMSFSVKMAISAWTRRTWLESCSKARRVSRVTTNISMAFAGPCNRMHPFRNSLKENNFKIYLKNILNYTYTYTYNCKYIKEK